MKTVQGKMVIRFEAAEIPDEAYRERFTDAVDAVSTLDRFGDVEVHQGNSVIELSTFVRYNSVCGGQKYDLSRRLKRIVEEHFPDATEHGVLNVEPVTLDPVTIEKGLAGQVNDVSLSIAQRDRASRDLARLRGKLA